MHRFDYFIPQFSTRVWGIRMVVTPDIVSEVLHMPRVVHPDYLSYECLMTVSKDELSFSSVRHLLHGVTVKTPHTRPLLKV